MVKIVDWEQRDALLLPAIDGTANLTLPRRYDAHRDSPILAKLKAPGIRRGCRWIGRRAASVKEVGVVALRPYRCY